jgi:hypothetical protein
VAIPTLVISNPLHGAVDAPLAGRVLDILAAEAGLNSEPSGPGDAGEARARAPVRVWLGYHGKGEPHTRSTGVATTEDRMIDKAAVTAVFEALGPERVARGLANAEGHTWEDCFLARAYGAVGDLKRAMRRDPRRRVANLLGLSLTATEAAKLLGVQCTAVAAVVHAFDHHTTQFRQLAEEWLEENHICGRPASTRRVVQAVLE